MKNRLIVACALALAMQIARGDFSNNKESNTPVEVIENIKKEISLAAKNPSSLISIGISGGSEFPDAITIDFSDSEFIVNVAIFHQRTKDYGDHKNRIEYLPRFPVSLNNTNIEYSYSLDEKLVAKSAQDLGGSFQMFSKGVIRDDTNELTWIVNYITCKFDSSNNVSAYLSKVLPLMFSANDSKGKVMVGWSKRQP